MFNFGEMARKHKGHFAVPNSPLIFGIMCEISSHHYIIYQEWYYENIVLMQHHIPINYFHSDVISIYEIPISHLNYQYSEFRPYF